MKLKYNLDPEETTSWDKELKIPVVVIERKIPVVVLLILTSFN